MGDSSQPGLRSLFRTRGFRLLFGATAISGLGDWVATLAFIALAFELTGSQTAVAVVLVLRLVPPMFAAPVGGFLADRVDRRLLMVASDLIRAGLIILVPFFGIGIVYVLAFLHECLTLVFIPARDASIPALARDEEVLPIANGLILGASFGSVPVAAALFGGLRLAASHVPTWIPFADVIRDHPTASAFFFDAFTFVLSAWIISRLQIPREGGAGESLFGGLAEGIRYLMGNQILRSLAAGLVVSMFGGGVLFAVGIAYIHDTLGGSDVDFGWLAALWGLGAAMGLGLVRLLIRERGMPLVFVSAVVLCSGVLVLMAVVPEQWLAFIAALVFGAAFSVAITTAFTMAQRVAEDRIRGRIMGAVQMLFRVGLGAGALGMGAVARSVGPIDVGIRLDGNQIGMLAGGGIILLGALASSGVLGRKELREALADEADPG
jgi:dTMP kinase